MERRAYALALAYCGTPFAGWQRQADPMLRPPASARQPAKPASSGRETIQAVVEAALRRVGLAVAVSAAARTDAGVHARRQLLTFRTREPVVEPAVLAALNAALPRAVRATGLRLVGPSFHARASPHLREYRYRVQLPRGPRSPARLAWNLPDARSLPTVPECFDAEAARAFLAGLTGRQDRAPHTTRPTGPKATSLSLAELAELPGGRLRFAFRGDGFTRHLVRNWVWAAVAHGCGVRAAFESTRGWRGPRAPGHGLILWDLAYADEPRIFDRC